MIFWLIYWFMWLALGGSIAYSFFVSPIALMITGIALIAIVNQDDVWNAENDEDEWCCGEGCCAIDSFSRTTSTGWGTAETHTDA